MFFGNMNNNIELRKVPAAILDRIAVILDTNEDWKRVMEIIPADLNSDHYRPKYTIEHLGKIEQYAKNNRLRGARVLFDEWGTSGQVRPTLQTLRYILVKAQMFRAADELAKLLNENPPPRPTNGPAAPVNLNVTSILNSTSALQNANTRKLSDNSIGAVNGTYDAQCNDPTRKMESAPNLIQFSKTEENLPNFEAMGHHTTEMIQNKNNNMQSASDLIVFSKDQSASPSSQYMPRMSLLLPDKDKDNSSISTMSGASTANSETSQSGSEISSQIQPSQSSNFQTETGSSLYEQVDNEILQDSNLVQFKYAELEAIARNFVPDSDSQVGSGGFADVFKGAHEKYGLLAIKRTRNLQLAPADIKIFNTEVKFLSILRHKNVVPILGFSLDGPAPCIVCRYIEGGSLMANIQQNTLNAKQRMKIIIGTAEGLKYIHNTVKPPTEPQPSSRKAYFLHGDVKSANILLTKDGVPMLCDFGLSKQCNTTHHTQSIIGTQAYMAPERFLGTITQKGDVYSFGVVLLELLTGKEPIILKDNECINIINYVEDICTDGNIAPILDPMIEGWNKAQKIYDLSKMCANVRRDKRPIMNVVCDMLHTINE